MDSLCNAAAIRKASRRITSFYDSTLEPSGLRTTQLTMLSEVLRSGPMTIGELADALVLDRSALGHNLRPLIRDGFIELRNSNADRRRSVVCVTKPGRTKAAEAKKLWRKAQDHFEHRFGVSESARIRALLIEIARTEFALP